MEEVVKSPPLASSSLEAVLPHQRLLWTPGEALTPASGRWGNRKSARFVIVDEVV